MSIPLKKTTSVSYNFVEILKRLERAKKYVVVVSSGWGVE